MSESVARTFARPGPPPWQLAGDVRARLEATMLGVLDEVCGDDLPSAARAVRRGGKRLRPAITLAVGRGADDGGAMWAASAVELLHHATLVHDDLLDGSTQRHGAETVNVTDGDGRALLTGDMLIAAAHVLAARSGPGGAITMAYTLADLCRGEAMQARQRFDPDVTVTQMLAVARLKAGSLLRAAAVLGGEVAGHPATTLTALARFGTEFGNALQLVDDLLDVLADAGTVGKPVGADFAGGTVTLPAIVAMQRHPELRAMLQPDPSETSRHRALRLLRCPLAVRATSEAAYEHATLAAAALGGTGDAHLEDLSAWPVRYVRRQLTALPEPTRERCCPSFEPVHDR